MTSLVLGQRWNGLDNITFVVFLDRDGGELAISLHGEGDGLLSFKLNDSGDSVIFKTGVDVRKFPYSLVMTLG